MHSKERTKQRHFALADRLPFQFTYVLMCYFENRPHHAKQPVTWGRYGLQNKSLAVESVSLWGYNGALTRAADSGTALPLELELSPFSHVFITWPVYPKDST